MRDFKGLLKIADDQLGAITEYAIPSVYDKDRAWFDPEEMVEQLDLNGTLWGEPLMNTRGKALKALRKGDTSLFMTKFDRRTVPQVRKKTVFGLFPDSIEPDISKAVVDDSGTQRLRQSETKFLRDMWLTSEDEDRKEIKRLLKTYLFRKDLDDLVKKASLRKKADPPHRGLNADNPLLRQVYKQVGYVPQAKGSYLHTPEMDADTQKMWQIHYDFMRRPENLGPNLSKPSTPQTQAADWDLKRARGEAPSHYLPRKNKGGAVVLGSYPMNGPTIAKHELGHYQDEKERRWRLWEDFSKAYYKNRIAFEHRAWDKSGVPESNPLRRSALKTYEMADEYDRNHTINGEYPGGMYDAQRAINGYFTNNTAPLAAATYSPPSAYIKSITSRKTGPRIIYDYNSALDAAKAGVKFHLEGL